MSKPVEKRAAILDAAMELIGENGFHNTPMSEIARRARVSAGIIYHYFESKDTLINQLYLEISGKLKAALLVANPERLDGIQIVRHLWLNAYHYCISHPREIVFLEQFKNSPYYDPSSEVLEEQEMVLMEKIQHEMEAGILVNVPFMVFYDLTFGVAFSLAKHQIAGIIEMDDTLLEKVAQAVCRSLQTA